MARHGVGSWMMPAERQSGRDTIRGDQGKENAIDGQEWKRRRGRKPNKMACEAVSNVL